MAIAAAIIAADLARAAHFDPLGVSQNLEFFGAAISDGGVGFRNPQLMARVPWYANIAARNGVMFDNAGQMANRRGWF